MSDFKPGDKVRCIDPNRLMIKNKIYDVVRIDVMIVMDDRGIINTFKDRFELVEQEIDYLDILKEF